MKRIVAAALAAFVGATLVARAQLGGPPSLGLDFGLFSKLTGVSACSAKADVQVLDKNRKEKSRTPLDLALLDNKLRVEINVAHMKNKDVPATATASLKEFGIDRIISVVRPDRKAIYIIVPGQQSLVNMPLSQEDVDNFEKQPKIEKTILGNETIDGHVCVKNKVAITDSQGDKHESTVWNATDLRDFPVQIETREKDDTVVVRLRQIQFTKPDAKQFDIPAGYAEYTDVQDMMQGLLLKLIRGVTAPTQE